MRTEELIERIREEANDPEGGRAVCYLALLLCKKVEELMRGEYICVRCGLRKDSEFESEADF